MKIQHVSDENVLVERLTALGLTHPGGGAGSEEWAVIVSKLEQVAAISGLSVEDCVVPFVGYRQFNPSD